MRLFISILCILVISASTIQTTTSALTPLRTTSEPDDPQAKVALQFINDYARLCLDHTGSEQIRMAWIEQHPLITDGFKTAHRKLLEDARKADPEMGLGFDPIFNAQDFPYDGFELPERDPDSGYIRLKGINWPEFIVIVKVVRQEDNYYIDGAGMVNIPHDRKDDH